MSDPVPIFGRQQPDGTFRPDDVYHRDSAIEQAADMTRLLQQHDVAREAQYIARVAVGQDPLNPIKDRRRVKRPRVVEDVFKKLCWKNAPNGQMQKRNSESFGPDGELWITRRELEHFGDRRPWGGKYSEDQIDTALVALESQGIIERRLFYNPEKHTSRIWIRLCPLNIIAILGAKKEYQSLGLEKRPRKRFAPSIAADLIFVTSDTSWMQAIDAGERIRAAASELYYEPALVKYLLPLTACVKELPCRVPNRADRRASSEDTVLIEFLKVLLRKWRVNPENHEFRHQALAFTPDAWRALSHEELSAAGFTEAQTVRCKRLLVASAFLEWVNLPSPGKNEPRIYARLRVDLILTWIREFVRSGRFSKLPKPLETGWIPSVIDPRSNIFINNTLVVSIAEPAGVRIQGKKLYPAGAGSDFFSIKDKQPACSVPGVTMAEYSAKCRAAMLKSAPASGDATFQAIISHYSELFAAYFVDHPLDHKVAAQLRSLVHRGALTQKMTLADLVRWRQYRGKYDPGHTDDDWKVFQTPESPEAMDLMLKNWAGIKRELYLFDQPFNAGFLESDVKTWGEDDLPLWESHIRCMKSDITQAIFRGSNHFPVRDDHRLPTLVALYQLDLPTRLAAYIREDRVGLKRATEKYVGLTLSLEKHYPDLMKALELPPSHWARLRRKHVRAFHKTQMLLAKKRLADNEIDELNAPWRVDSNDG